MNIIKVHKFWKFIWSFERYPHRNRTGRNRSPVKHYAKLPQSPKEPVNRRLNFSQSTEQRSSGELVVENVPVTRSFSMPSGSSSNFDRFEKSSGQAESKKPPPQYERTRDENLKPCRVMYDFKGEFEGCLEVKKGQNLSLHKNLNDGWSLVETEEKKKGFVPGSGQKINIELKLKVLLCYFLTSYKPII